MALYATSAAIQHDFRFARVFSMIFLTERL